MNKVIILICLIVHNALMTKMAYAQNTMCAVHTVKIATDFTAFLKIANESKLHLNIKSENCSQKTLDSFFLGLKKGISCLESLNTPQTKKFVQRIDALLLNKNKTIKLQCLNQLRLPEAFALSTYPYEENYPTISFNNKRPSPDMQALGFHEFLHLLGYPFYHGYEPDRTNACETCCFGSKSVKSCQTCSEIPIAESKMNCSFLTSKYPTIDKNKIYNHNEKEILDSYPGSKDLALKGNMKLFDIIKCYP